MNHPLTSTLTASLGFFDSHLDIYNSEKPYACLVPLTHAPKDFEQSNIHGSDKNVEVIDIRGAEGQFQLDVNGFELVHHSTTFNTWHNGKSVVREYYPLIADLVKKVTGANISYVYDHTVSSSSRSSLQLRNWLILVGQTRRSCRYTRPRARSSRPTKYNGTRWYVKAYLRLTHLTTRKDLTLEGARRQIETDFGPKAEAILSRRFQVIKSET